MRLVKQKVIRVTANLTRNSYNDRINSCSFLNKLPDNQTVADLLTNKKIFEGRDLFYYVDYALLTYHKVDKVTIKSNGTTLAVEFEYLESEIWTDEKATNEATN